MPQTLPVVSVPAGHPYVQRVLASRGLGVLPDPPHPGAPAGQWWPPRALEPGWIERHGDEARVLHLHFGFESFSPDELIAAVDAAHRAGWQVVQTVHDLENPQLTDQRPHLAALDALVPAVDSVITLTPGAAAEIERRWGRSATVLPHPRLLPDGIEAPAGFSRDRPVVGVHLKDLRPSVDGSGTVGRLLHALDLMAGEGAEATAEVHLHRSVRDEPQRDAVRALCAERDDVVLVEHDRYDDRALANALSHLDVCLLPYRFGTHSGWLELCWDLGVAVAAPTIGHLADQHDDPTVATFPPGDDGSLLASALTRLLAVVPRADSEARRRLAAARLEVRRVQDQRTADAHETLFRSLLSIGAAR